MQINSANPASVSPLSKWLPPDRHTIGDYIAAVLRIRDEKEALNFYEASVDWYRQHPGSHTPEETARQNIGWCFGEGMPQERIDMWVRACGAFHPVFGTKLPADPDEMFRAGMAAGERLFVKRSADDE